jgi:hypothetical protein
MHHEKGLIIQPKNYLKGQFMDEEIRGYYEMFGDILWMVGFASLLTIISQTLRSAWQKPVDFLRYE